MDEEAALASRREIGTRIRAARKEKGLTLVELGKLVGYAHNSLSRWESGEQTLTMDQLLRLAAALDKPLAYFLGLDFAGADMSRAAELMRQAKARIEDLMVQAAQPDLPGLLGDLVEAVRPLTEDQQREVIRYAHFLREKSAP